MDELALAADTDPLEFRLRHLGDPRARAVLEAAAEHADWPDCRERSADGEGWGLALAQYKNLQCYCAIIVKLRVDREIGDIQLVRAVIAADAGQVVNPDGLSNQLEGGFVQAASWTLYEEVKFDARGITNVDWESYPILRFPAAPIIETIIINRRELPMLGAGEAAQESHAGRHRQRGRRRSRHTPARYSLHAGQGIGGAMKPASSPQPSAGSVRERQRFVRASFIRTIAI